MTEASTMPARNSETFRALVAATVHAVLGDLHRGGKNTPRMVGEDLLRRLGGDEGAWREAARQVAARQSQAGGHAASGRTGPGTTTLGAHAVAWRCGEAAVALIAHADDATAGGMVRAAILTGWDEGAVALLDSGAAVLGDRDWRDTVLRETLEKPHLLRRLVARPMVRGGEYSAARFFGSPSIGLDVALGLAASARREELLAIIQAEAPAMLADMEGGAGRYGRDVRTNFFSRLRGVVGGMDDAGLDFLVETVCCTPETRWDMALAMAAGGPTPARLEMLCRRHPDMAEAIAQQAGTARGVRAMVTAIASRRPGVSVATPDWIQDADETGRRCQHMAWVVCVAGMAGRSPTLRRLVGGTGIQPRLLTAWMAARNHLRLGAGSPEAGDPGTGRRRRRA